MPLLSSVYKWYNANDKIIDFHHHPPGNAPPLLLLSLSSKKQLFLHFSLKFSTLISLSLSLSLSLSHIFFFYASHPLASFSQFSQSSPSILFNCYKYSLHTYIYIHTYFGNMITHRFLLYLVTLAMMISASMEVVTANSWVGSKYQIECTMCSACDNPCSVPSPPPPVPSPPPPPPSPSPPPPSTPSSPNCPPPPSPPSSGNYYYSPPPPSRPSYSYSSPPPPSGVIGGLYPPPYRNYPTPPPPNPIVPYFPFYYYSPPPPAMSGSVKLTTCSVIYTTITLLSSFLFLL